MTDMRAPVHHAVAGGEACSRRGFAATGWGYLYGICFAQGKGRPHRRYGFNKGEFMDVKDCMQTAVTTVTPDTLMSTAYQMMTMRSERIRHLPVVTDGHTLVGVITARDVSRAAA